jgi:hypothetical protein
MLDTVLERKSSEKKLWRSAEFSCEDLAQHCAKQRHLRKVLKAEKNKILTEIENSVQSSCRARNWACSYQPD